MGEGSVPRARVTACLIPYDEGIILLIKKSKYNNLELDPGNEYYETKEYNYISNLRKSPVSLSYDPLVNVRVGSKPGEPVMTY